MGLAGKKIGPYNIITQIGSGGMAVVYRAEQPALGRSVAIKELRTDLARDTAIAARFEREAKSIAALGHQNIVHVYDFISRGSSMYIVMEYVEGIDLYTLLQRVGRLPSDIAGIIALQTVRALEYAHYRGVIHRDLKPSNLMITKQGEVKLMDFGIARDETKEDLTLPGQALGTPSYMSPEQIMGERVDFRSDLFSFGIVLYQMLTGKKPFVEDETVSVMYRILNEPYERPRRVYPDIPFALQSTIKRCMQKDPKNRFPRTELLRLELEKFVSRKVRTNYNGRLVVYLRHRDIISDSEAKTYVRQEEIDAPETMQTDSGGVNGWNLVIRPALLTQIALMLVAGLLAFSSDWLAVGMERGYVRINAQPWADVYVNGELFDTTPFARVVALPPGEHEIEFRNKHFKSITRKVTIGSGETKKLQVDMRKGR